MLRLSKLFIITCLSLSVLSTASHAEDKPVDIPPPPAIPDKFEEQSNIKADVTIRKGKHKVVEEYRINGELYLVRVIPTIGKPYYIRYPDGAAGAGIRNELEDIKTPFWKLFEW